MVRCAAVGGCGGGANAPDPLRPAQGPRPREEGHCGRQQDRPAICKVTAHECQIAHLELVGLILARSHH